jgi:hypothetical protein
MSSSRVRLSSKTLTPSPNTSEETVVILDLENSSRRGYLLLVSVHELQDGEWRPTAEEHLLAPGAAVSIELEAGRRRAELQELPPT